MSAHFMPWRVLLLLALVGLLASAVGFVGGAYLGYQVERSSFGWDCVCEDPGWEGLLYGSALGPVLLTPLSVYLANRRRGSLAASLAASAGIAGVAIVGLHVGVSLFVIFLIFAAPVAQVFSAMLIAECTSKGDYAG